MLDALQDPRRRLGRHDELDPDVRALPDVGRALARRPDSGCRADRGAVRASLARETHHEIPGQRFADDGHEPHGVGSRRHAEVQRDAHADVEGECDRERAASERVGFASDSARRTAADAAM